MRDNDPQITTGPNRTVFFVILVLAGAVIMCGLLTQAVGAARLCGGGLLLVGGVFFLLAEDKRWPLVLVLIGLALFFGGALVGG